MKSDLELSLSYKTEISSTRKQQHHHQQTVFGFIPKFCHREENAADAYKTEEA